jgi:hypothetical protein
MKMSDAGAYLAILAVCFAFVALGTAQWWVPALVHGDIRCAFVQCRLMKEE